MGPAALMQRVRIGLTGLACVFLLVLLAAAMLGLAGPADAPSGPSTNMAAGPATPSDQPKEPLAELGVAPGNLPDGGTTNSTQRIALPPTR